MSQPADLFAEAASAAAAAPRALRPGFDYYPGYYSPRQQRRLLDEVNAVLAAAPLFTQHMPRTGHPLSVRMSNAGEFGWVSDREQGYRYLDRHPLTGKSWPPIPPMLRDLWRDIADYPAPANLCLINFYDGEAKLGLHQDKGGESLEAPVVSVSLGDDARFLVGGTARNHPTTPVRLKSGDVMAFGGPARLVYHSVSRVYPGSSALLAGGGRINLTLRRVDR
jgi:alkylated DNA repair protein (DNA oxidative demethylase)